ncbi:MAG TPA: PEP/pyruvate-binding domain-containing protein [Bacteroidales bacterium]|nr:PEP/pyruvate-binding domain-containing protein [Bacteroidales bacterium]
MPGEKTNLSKHFQQDTSFDTLMKKRIYHVLLISSAYDAFILEEDGRIDEQIFNEYVSLNLRYPPQFIQVTNEESAFEELEEGDIDLVITMLSAEDDDTFGIARKIRDNYDDIPIVVLTPFSRKVTINFDKENLSAIDYIFSWLGNADLLLAIIKLIEDKMNAEHDVNEVGVQTILLVEDSVRFYSSYLPNIYKIIFKQSQGFMMEGLNEHQQMMRMRGRPKILLARNYEEAVSLYDKYKNNLLGVISDIAYERKGKVDKEAGLRLAKKIKAEDNLMPILLQSSDAEQENRAKELKVGFINKQSKTISIELKSFITEYFAFGDFVFVDPGTMLEVDRAKDLKTLQRKIHKVPDASLRYHLVRNHISKWLRARALFPLAERFRDVTLDDFDNLEEVKKYLFDSIGNYRMTKARGVIAEFRRDSFDEYLSLSRIGEGSLGGKARGLAFLDSMIKRNHLYDKWEGVRITIPKTVVLGTDIFDQFMEENDLYQVAMSDLTDMEILQRFISANLPFRIKEDLYTLITFVRRPLAIRSSSLLEDSYYQPFAGIYSTYMIPNLESDERRMMNMLTEAIKSVYASAFFKDSKAYMAATSNVIDEEKMAIVLQQVVGRRYHNRFYPIFSGVARSINFYPRDPEKPEDGIANIALGLGKYIVDGGMTLRFSPKYPKKVLQTSTPELALRETQRHFYALDLMADSFKPCINDAVNLLNLRLSEAEKDKSIRFVASTYDYHSKMLRDGIHPDGKKLVTFSAILNHNVFPLAEILLEILETGQREMGKPIEIEFAVDMSPDKNEPHTFHLLQIRPIVDNDETVDVDLENIPSDSLIMSSDSALGTGYVRNIRDLVYVKPDSFDALRTHEIAEHIGKLNDKFLAEGKNYILVGPGRWGSADPHLGIPVKWPQISAARLIVESGLEDYHIDPSQGTHFFQNLTSFRVGYFTINPFINEGSYDVKFLDQQKAQYEDEFIRHIRFSEAAVIAIDGKKNRGVVMKPENM